MIRILVTGSRVFECTATGCPKMFELEQAIANYLGPERWDEEGGMPREQVGLVVGDCPTGMDFIAKEWAINSWVNWEEFKADWNAYGSAAGPVRNQRMVNTEPDVCLGFPLVLHSWSGTMDCMTRAQEARIPVYVAGELWYPEPWMVERRIDVSDYVRGPAPE